MNIKSYISSAFEYFKNFKLIKSSHSLMLQYGWNKYFNIDYLREILERKPNILIELKHFVYGVVLYCFASVVYSVGINELSASEAVTTFSKTTLNLGLWAVSLICFMEFVLGAFKGSMSFEILTRAVKRYFMLTLVVLIVHVSGDSVIELYHGEPLVLAQGLGILLCILIGFKLAENKNNQQYAIAREGMPAAGVAISIEPIRTQTDIDHTAVHEAGHALVHALLYDLPPNFYASVIADHNEGSLGRVGTSNGLGNSKSKQQLEWAMWRDVAGFAAEAVIFSEGKTGSGSDLAKWEETARLYFSSGFGDYYYKNPSSDAELDNNKNLFQNLKDSHIEDVKRYLEINVSILHELSKELKAKDRLSSEELKKFIDRCNTQGFEKVALEFTV